MTRTAKNGSAVPVGDMQRVLEDLRSHQVELQMQNEELAGAQALLAAEKERYANLFDFAPVGFLVLDQFHMVAECNLTAAGMLGVERQRLLRTRLGTRIAPDQERAFKQFLMDAGTRPAASAVFPVLRTDGVRFHAHFDCDPVPNGGGMRLAMTDISPLVAAEEQLRAANEGLEQLVAQKTAALSNTVQQLSGEVAERKKREQELRKANDELSARTRQLQRLTSQLVQTEQRERKRIAQILHDTLQQQLAAIRLLVGGLAERSPEDAWREELVRAEEQIGDAIRTTRTLTTELNPPALTQGGLISGLEWLAKWMEQKHGLHIELEVETRRLEMDDEMKLLLFDSVRELLFNVAKHADAPLARVGLQAIGSGLKVTVSDEGRGFDPQAAADGQGFGLFSIRERLQTLDGRMHIESESGRGSRFTLYVPQVLAPARSDGRIRLVLVDDHAAIREGLARLLGKERDMEVVGQASDGEGAVALAHKLRPDVVLMDIEMPGVDGIEATRRILPHCPRTKILGFSMHTDGELTKALLAAGGVGFLSKSSSLDELVKAIRSTAAPA